MAERNLISAVFNDSGEQTTEPNPTFFTVTPKTIRLGHGSEIFPIRNLTRIGKYRVLEKRFPILGIVILGLVGLGCLFSFSAGGVIVGLLLLAGAGYGILNRMQPKTFAFGFQTNAGGTRYLYVKDEAFIDQIVGVVTKYIESEQNAGVVINIEDRSIKNVGFINGDVRTG